MLENLSKVLDDRQKMEAVDRSGMRIIQMSLPEHCEDAAERAQALKMPNAVSILNGPELMYKEPKKVLIVAVGGSAIGGDLLRDWLMDVLPVPIVVSRDYHIPAWADEDTLVLAVSYSGNTEEALSGFAEAIERKCMVVGVSSNGKLKEYCSKLGIPSVELPEGLPPRTAIGYLFIPLAVILGKFGMPVPVEEIDDAISTLREVRTEIDPDRPTEFNPSKKLAVELYGTNPVIYGFGQYQSVARRMKTQFNENSKVLAMHDVFPELNHNEILGWLAPERLTKGFTVLLIRDPEEPDEISVRIEVTRKLALNEKACRVLELHPTGKTKLARMLAALYQGDLVSFYLAVLYGVDPTPTELITRMKRELEKNINVLEQVELQIKEWTERK